MTNPYDPHENKDPKDSEQSFNPYPPSNHPEDQPNYGYGASTQGNSLPQYGQYGAESDNYGSGYGGYGDYSSHGAMHPTTKWPMVTGNPQRVEIGQGIAFAFKETFGNALFWILGSIVFFIVTFVISVAESYVLGFETSAFSSIISGLLSIFIYRLAFNATSGEKLTLANLTKGYNYWTALAVVILVGILGVIVLLGIVLMFGMGGAVIFTAINTTEAMSFGVFFLVFTVVLILAIVIVPFTMMITLYPIEKPAGIGESFTKGFELAKNNFSNLALYYVAVGAVMVFMTILTLGIGIIVALPFAYLTSVYAFRTVSGGARPVKRH